MHQHAACSSYPHPAGRLKTLTNPIYHRREWLFTSIHTKRVLVPTALCCDSAMIRIAEQSITSDSKLNPKLRPKHINRNAEQSRASAVAGGWHRAPGARRKCKIVMMFVGAVLCPQMQTKNSLPLSQVYTLSCQIYANKRHHHHYRQGTPAAPMTKDVRMGFTGTYGPDNAPLAPGDVVSISKLPCESAPYSEGRFRPCVCASLNPTPKTLNSKPSCV